MNAGSHSGRVRRHLSGDRVLRDLRELQAERAIDLTDAVAVYLTDEGRLLVDESVKPTSEEGATLGGLLGVPAESAKKFEQLMTPATTPR